MAARDEEKTLMPAVAFAIIKHKGQTRKASGDPFVVHPVGVSNILWSEGGIRDHCTLEAAILHDTVEDTTATIEEIEEVFGKRTASIVAEVTDDKSLSQSDRKRAQLAHVTTMSDEAKLVKMADSLYNIRDMLSLVPEKWDLLAVQGYCVWKRAIFEAIGAELNPLLSKKMDTLLGEGTFVKDGKEYPALPVGVDLGMYLEQYFLTRDQKKK